jgi:hypothetical protein
MKKYESNYCGNGQILCDELLTKYDIEPPRCGVFVGPGWVPAVDRMLGRLIEAGWDKNLAQIKQKFCRLRVYLDRTPQDPQLSAKLERIISTAETECDNLCEACGKSREFRGMGTGMAICNKCEREMENV